MHILIKCCKFTVGSFACYYISILKWSLKFTPISIFFRWEKYTLTAIKYREHIISLTCECNFLSILFFTNDRAEVSSATQ